jgi:hypothetical protein
MSHIIMTDPGLNQLLEQLLKQAGSLQLVNGSFWGLYTNNHTPTQSDTLATYTEASYPSYSRVTDSQASYPSPTTTAHVTSTTRTGAVVWTVPSSGSPVNCYGAILIASDGTTLLGATLFDSGPYQVSVGSAAITESPTFTLQSLY